MASRFNGGGPGLEPRGTGGDFRGGTEKPTDGYLDVICLTILVYDLMLTFPPEVSLIRGTKWGLAKILYLLSRYFPIFVFSFYLAFDLSIGPLPKHSDWLLNVNLFFVEAHFSLRTWAVWNHNRRVGVLLLTLFSSLWITTFVLFSLIQVGTLDVRTFVISFGTLTGFYFCTSTLMCLRAYHSSLRPGTSFIRTIHLHGVLYYLFLFILSLFSLISTILHRDKLQVVLPRVIQISSTVMVTRMTLNLREAGARTVRTVDTDDAVFMNISTQKLNFKLPT